MVVKAADAREISAIVTYANEAALPIFPRGGGTGLNGGTIPDRPGVILYLERLAHDIEVDDKNLMVIADAGVTLPKFNEGLKASNELFFPIHPGDEGAQVGGMVAESAGGVSAVKHGIMRNHVKGLEVGLPTGEIVQLGGRLIKTNMGYDLLHMMIGSEGILGIITKVTLKLYAKQRNSGTLLLSFDSRQDASDTGPKILQSGITPQAIEYCEKTVIQASAQHMGIVWPAKEGVVDLMIILEESSEDDLYEKSEAIARLAEEFNVVDSIIAETAKDQRNILQIRGNVYTAFIEHAGDGMDISVPPPAFPP